ncbi:unnamed protein product [Ectocarpus sp. CCAP 1310/34]|nr:unnamed protein product [Ectocarpus sp. CCAP 1310/34]
MTVMVSHHAFKPSDAQVQIAVRDSMLKQFPVVSGQVYKDEQLSMEAPFGRHASCLDDMWDVLDKRAFAHTSAVHGDEFFSVSSTNTRSSSAVSRAAASSVLRSTVTPSWSQGSSAAVMSVDPLPNDDRDPFLLHYSDWPLHGRFQEVYNVASEMALTKNDAPLFTPLVSAEERRNALRLYKGKCLNCLEEDHSFKSSPAPPFDDKCEYTSDDVPLFWKPPSVFSQWTPSAFDVLGVRYSCGLIQHSTSRWASPLVAIPKKDGSVRITVNYKRLNALVDLDGQPFPRVDGILDTLCTGKVFSIFDLNSAFHQIVCDEDTVPLTAFCTPTQLFEWLRMPQGANASPSWFVKVINRVVHGLERVLAYLDDDICFDEEPLGHVLNLIEFFKRLRQC